MIQIKLLYIIIFALGINLVTNWNIEYSFSRDSQLNNSGGILDTKLQTNSLNLSKPIYQAINSTFFATQNISSNPFSITKEFVFEVGVMNNIGKVTNNITIINTYLPDSSIQAKGNGTIRT